MPAERSTRPAAAIAFLAIFSFLAGAAPIECRAQTPSEIRSGVEEIERLIEREREVLRRGYRDPDWKLGEPGAREGQRSLAAEIDNLVAMLEVLKVAILRFGRVRLGGLAESDTSTSPPIITLSDDLRTATPQVIAQNLAHEAVHLLHKGRRWTVDEEYLCFKKEAAVWGWIKGSQQNKSCDAALAISGLPEKEAKAKLDAAYRRRQRR